MARLEVPSEKALRAPSGLGISQASRAAAVKKPGPRLSPVASLRPLLCGLRRGSRPITASHPCPEAEGAGEEGAAGERMRGSRAGGEQARWKTHPHGRCAGSSDPHAAPQGGLEGPRGARPTSARPPRVPRARTRRAPCSPPRPGRPRGAGTHWEAMGRGYRARRGDRARRHHPSRPVSGLGDPLPRTDSPGRGAAP